MLVMHKITPMMISVMKDCLSCPGKNCVFQMRSHFLRMHEFINPRTEQLCTRLQRLQTLRANTYVINNYEPYFIKIGLEFLSAHNIGRGG